MKINVILSQNLLSLKAFFLALCFVVFSNVLFAFEHPGGMHSKEQIEFVKKQIGQKNEPFYSAYKQLLSLADSALLDENHAVADFSIPGYYQVPALHIKNSKNLAKDAFDSCACALIWQRSGEKKYARRALYFINAWSYVNKLNSESDGTLVMSYTGSAMVMAAELMYN